MSTAVMTEPIAEASPRFKARMAGVSYLLGSLTSVFGQMVVLGMLVVPASATATAASILSHESLFRLGSVASLMTVPFHLIWAVLFYGLFKPVNRSVSLLAGFVMLLAGLQRMGWQGNEDELATVLASNLCRCTGYQGLMRAARSLLLVDSTQASCDTEAEHSNES